MPLKNKKLPKLNFQVEGVLETTINNMEALKAEIVRIVNHLSASLKNYKENHYINPINLWKNWIEDIDTLRFTVEPNQVGFDDHFKEKCLAITHTVYNRGDYEEVYTVIPARWLSGNLEKITKEVSEILNNAKKKREEEIKKETERITSKAKEERKKLYLQLKNEFEND